MAEGSLNFQPLRFESELRCSSLLQNVKLKQAMGYSGSRFFFFFLPSSSSRSAWHNSISSDENKKSH